MAEDQTVYRTHSIIHTQRILSEEIQSFTWFSSAIPPFEDTAAITAQKTEEYYLPTFDQEQGSTQGNMLVLEHYFGKVLDIPKETFEHTMFTVLGDRLTTVRDHAAQDQCAVDRSTHRFDHLSSFSMVSGLMHFCLNFIHAVGGNYWGDKNTDAVSLSTLLASLPNRKDINLRKVDYYAWLRFLDVILRGLVIQAALKICDIRTLDNFKLSNINLGVRTYAQFVDLATSVVDSFLLPSAFRLENLGIKTLKGNTQSGHSILLMHDLMTLREMQHAIKHGHPQRISRMIKYWLPMFYAAGSHNYANECMELLHNVTHDWPKDYASVAFNGMLVNPSGKPDGWKPTDIRVEHLNDKIKERAHGSNATPDVLEKTTPALGHVQILTDRLFEDLGIEKINQEHAKVLQHKDIEIVAKVFHKAKIFDFAADKPSKHAVVDLYHYGCQRLAGTNGGHAKHLNRHILRLRSRHDTGSADIAEPDPELMLATDAIPRNYTMGSENDEVTDLVAPGGTVDNDEIYDTDND
ncbi:uncharacterized protein LACBIDRAFT_300405 [Laccaria bicolor S238N-H82]|uniref:Predicted protein n=1 Tax=Laccaria bicolor (strain S238N-H82 / ATCC MYA-4686) TaxID=486041 RepID=B0DGP3_LACBS|nr:uncharacterized protein LACBIDRAFT_300405 [Laccaria bicolor S238N-H82]EDR06303.1 predicted protein [Laccaria bicolor S238N-H82]|eukprot:XP_001883164.1 predicted protein [Laccaria bicolor S238N-H82]